MSGVAKVAQNGWALEANCEENCLAMIYIRGDKGYYKVVYLDSMEVEDGEMEN